MLRISMEIKTSKCLISKKMFQITFAEISISISYLDLSLAHAKQRLYFEKSLHFVRWFD